MLFHSTSEPECYPKLTKARKASLELNRNFAAKYGSVQVMEKDGEKYCKTCYGCQLVALQGLSEPERFHLGEFWLLICSDHFLLRWLDWIFLAGYHGKKVTTIVLHKDENFL